LTLPAFWQIRLGADGRDSFSGQERAMNPARFTLPNLRAIAPDLAAFGGGLLVARALGWNTTDLVWSLWLSSLVLGYLTILSAIGRCAFVGSAIVFSEAFPAQYRVKGVLVGSGIALFVLTFFSLHFCGFHAVHASFLSSFFPPPGVPKQAFRLVFFNPIALWKATFHYLMPQYGAFLIPVVIAERRALFGSVEALIKARHVASGQDAAQLFKAAGVSGHGLFSRPYLNVVRMHALIFFFAICHALKMDSVPIYIVVYSVYFFPWSSFRKPTDGAQAAPREAAQSA
jgi:hypothetical protein